MSTALLASIVVAIVGILLLWANPRRKVNRAVFACSATVSAWLTCKHLAALGSADGLLWFRWSHAIGGLMPLILWMVKEGIVGNISSEYKYWIRRNVLWFLSGVALFSVPFSDLFIPSYSSQEDRIRGFGYYSYYIGIIILYAKLLRDTVVTIKTVSGVSKLELQVWLLGGCAVATVIYLLSGLGEITGSSVYRSLQPIAILIFYGGTAYAITSHRIFDARQIMLVGLEKVLLVCISALAAYAFLYFVEPVLSEGLALVTTSAIVLLTSGGLRGWLDSRFQFLPKGSAARQAAFATAQRETRVDKLEDAFRTLLRSWGQTEHSVIVTLSKDAYAANEGRPPPELAISEALQQLRWATPERLARERFSPERKVIQAYLDRNHLGAIALGDGTSLAVVIGVAVGASRRPYTYPEVLQLMELAAIIQGALERAHYSAKAKHAEQLATVGLLGASLAHEIRNPLVSIKTFVQLFPTHYGDVNFRDKFSRLISDEVGRIDQLTEQLLDLATPRTYVSQQVRLHELLQATMDIVAAKAAHHNVQVIADLKAESDIVYTDASAAKQVMINLCFNAIQAVEERGEDSRWVSVSTRNTGPGVEMAVSDGGPGIAPEIRAKLFQPFQTTKSSGFGLGLAICSDILSNLSAEISVDPYTPGTGATFRVIFPCHPPSL